ncbi:hypothetical protein [Kribbella sp. CA-293567]|uniref:hypothetical protein n=1 Tax=Kribbella sp. CA-293567 TaxID=3002436 RepID=UPI0022DE4EF9|nr:hypothetical protein [Kribbella sp. CA-293567]WBQ08336.1 hypothetical protein OX958_16345 [Kribbella sp. CA-293567]
MRLAKRIAAIGSVGLLTVVALTTSSNAQPIEPVAAPAATADAEHDTVYATGKDRAGNTTVTIYDPAKGVTPDQLRDKLRRSGVTGVLAKGQQPPSNQPTQQKALACLSEGTARQWCDHQWSYGAYNDPQVYFLDSTSSAWPVIASVTEWNRATGIDSFWKSGSTACPTGVHCVTVANGAYGSTGWLGLTTWTPNTQGPVSVKLNDSYTLTAAERRTIACHELGHALSLNHNTSTTSCLYSGTYVSLVPNADDYKILPLIYPLAGT